MYFINRYISYIFFNIPVTWAGSFIAGKYLVLEIDPLNSVFWRFLLSAAVMLPFLLIFHRTKHPTFSQKKFIWHMAFVIATSGMIYHIFFFWALNHTTPTNTALIIAMNPFFTALGEIIFLKQRRTFRFYAGFFLAFAGAIWVIVTRNGELSSPGFGELLCLVSSLSWSVYTVGAKMTKDPTWDPLWIGAYNYLFTALLLVPIILFWGNFDILHQITIKGGSALLYMAIFPTAIGYTLYYIGVQSRGPAWAATYIYLVPSFTANLDHLFFKASFTVPMVIGTSMVVAGLLLGNLNFSAVQFIKRRWDLFK